MLHDVIALTRRDRVVLALVQGEAQVAGSALLEVRAEDGARFKFPADQALVRARVDVGDAISDDTGGALATVRRSAVPFTSWLAIHATLADRGPVDVAQITRVAQAADLLDSSPVPAELCVALGVTSSAPWFRRCGTRLETVPMPEALQALLEQRLQAFVTAGDDAVVAWWPGRAAGLPEAWGDVRHPAAVRARVFADRARFIEMDYAPDRAAAAADAMVALSDWALAGATDETARGRDLARRIGLPDEPDIGLEELVACGVVAEDVVPAARRAGLDGPVADDVTAECRVAARPADLAGREDLRAEFCVAIDDPATREVDDALSIRRCGDHVELLVHIADVAAHVPPGGALDAEMRCRASSLYLPDGMVFLVPDDDLVDALSLRVDLDRAALTGVFRIDPAGEVVERRVVRSVIRLRRRIAYDESRDTSRLGVDAEHGALLATTAQRLRDARVRRGARVTGLASPKVAISADGVASVRLRRQDTPGDLVVSEAMILLNSAAGDLLAEAGAPALFRAQEAGVPEGREVPDEDDPLHDLRLRRTFRPVETGVVPRPHAGLGAAAYSQTTSPLRRYGDLVNQRQLIAAVSGASPPYLAEELADLFPHLQIRERAVRSAGDAWAMVWTARALVAEGATALDGVLSRRPRHGHGHVWVPRLARELPLRAPREWRAPAVGAVATWPVSAVHPWRGRIVLGPPAE